MTNKTPNNPNPARPRIITNAQFKTLAELAFFDRTTSLPVAISAVTNISPRSIERWLAKDEQIPPPIDVIKILLDIATAKVGTQADFLKAIKTALK